MLQTYVSYLKNRFPKLPELTEGLISENLISPFVVHLPKSLLQQAQLVASSLFALRSQEDYQREVLSLMPATAQKDPGNKSICMSYDFHVGADGNLKLIEVNTNAAFLLMGYLLYQARHLPLPIADFDLNEFKENCLEESHLARQKMSSVAIVDESPTSQRLYIEFLLYKELFQEFGFETEILDLSELQFKDQSLRSDGRDFNFIYNRSTDFYLEELRSQSIRDAYESEKITLSPNPHEYALLADKRRLIEWSLAAHSLNSPYQEILPIAKNLLRANFLTTENSQELWSQRKKLFFKPLSSFGSKGSYRGEGISRSHFEQLLTSHSIAQEYAPAPELLFEAEGYPATKLKYDLRFYTYKDRVQLVMARLYQGQVTNARTPLGGFAPVLFE
jgi:hypothetical protein